MIIENAIISIEADSVQSFPEIMAFFRITIYFFLKLCYTKKQYASPEAGNESY